MTQFQSLCGFILTCAASCTAAQDVNPERDPIQIENWFFYQQNTNQTGQWQYAPRIYIPFKLENGWKLTQRADLSFIDTNQNGPANETGHFSGGMGNSLLETMIETPELTDKLTLRGSVRLVFPAPKGEPFGKEVYQIAPMVGLSYQLAGQLNGVTLSPYLRYFHSIGNDVSSSDKVSSMDIYPEMTFQLNPTWSAVLYSEHAISYNYIKHSWFVPLDILLVNQLSKNVSLAFGGAVKLGNPSDASYNYIVNTRLNFSY